MLTSTIVFDYVWRHFVSVFPAAADLPVAYGEQQEGKVVIESSGLLFLAKSIAFPEQIYWHTWQKKELPFLFDLNSEELLSAEENSVTINSDIIASAFYFLSGWQEFYSTERDKFGRFPYRASLQSKHNFVTLPVVNYYFAILKTALEKAYAVSLKNPEWENRKFVTFLSHDIDRLESAWKVEGLKQLKKGNIFNFANLAFRKFSQKDHWQNLETVAEIVKKYGAISTFFWLPKAGKQNGHPNADYEISQPKNQKEIKKLAENGFEIGLHGSFGTSENLTQFNAEKAKIPEKVTGNRFHYLCYDPKKTPQMLAETGITYDASLGFAEHFGFRSGYCFPFRPFNFLNLQPYPFLEIPLNLMDATLWHPNYLRLEPDQIIPAIKPMLQEIRKFGGCFGLLWHNENFSELNRQNGLAVFETIMQELKNMESGFKTGNQLAEIFQTKI